MQSLPIGIDDFTKLRRGDYYFVDKTLAIRDFLDTHGEVLLLTRPRRFGKTLFLSMFYYFFSAVQAEENRKLFRGLAIERAGASYMAEQGKRPVLFVTLKDLKHRIWVAMLDKFRFLLSDLYDRYAYLLEVPGFS